MKKLYIYHVNDLHSHFENWPKIVHYLNERKRHHDENGEDYLLLDIGDHVDRFHPITEATEGKANVELLNQLQFDAVTIGNNEGITLSYETLNSLYKEADFTVVLSNLFDELKQRPEWMKPYHIIELKTGYKIGLIGVTVFYEKFYKQLGWQIKDPFQAVQESLFAIKDQVDLVVLMSHLGISDDEIMANEFPDIDLILGAHTHHLLCDGKFINGVLLGGAEKYGHYVGCIEITYEKENFHLLKKKARVEEMINLSQTCKTTEAWLQKKEKESRCILSKEIVHLHEAIPLEWFESSDFTSILVSSIKEWCQGEVAMVNAGMLLAPLPAGPVTKGDLHRICPHPINPCKVFLKGDELKEVILQASTEKMEHLRLKGLGFRGKVMGQMVYDGIDVVKEKLDDGEMHVTSILVNGQPLDPDKLYGVATVDMFTLGPLYPVISHADKKTYFMPEFLRDLLEWKLKSIQQFKIDLDSKSTLSSAGKPKTI
ncbi:bifunctional metallophosphatase/5'-nucleotidase [Metabacillus arenae]|uniref:Bifunctional metallophosphatase/5'-nucleotidase n=1 Tax=Metabacillus arenae TaxID=2771434 RepID=A0A926RXA7_9BACI|nr:bifunctional UDP-sugar hydrolase/5'-nucleotidase [Metabacillus arenae]MBD1380806.1 bifunctional metallophosphatase/5'-nucleotidase [Metabacillus arenae]